MGRPRIVVGLGNPGTRYRDTRHNLGFRVVERIAAEEGVGFQVEGALGRHAWYAELEGPEGWCVLAKPRTYMNRSGRAASLLCRLYEVDSPQLLVVYDDADLELGRIRIRSEGGAGGHNGMRSIIDALRTTEFPRVRLGVGGTDRREQDLADYLLSEFDVEERPVVDALVQLGAEAVSESYRVGVRDAMNQFNGRRAVPEHPPAAED